MRLRFWINKALTVTAATIGSATLFGLLMWLTRSEDSSSSPLLLGGVYLIILGCLQSLIMTFAAYDETLPTALAFGSSRKEAFVGMQLFRLLPSLIHAILATVLFSVMYGGFRPACLIITTVSMVLSLIFGAWGSIMSSAKALHLNKVLQAFIVVIGLLLIVGCLAIFILFTIHEETVIVTILSHPAFYWVLGLIALSIYGLSLIPEKKAIYACSVKL